MGDFIKCKWCGKTFEKSNFNKFKSGWTMGIAGKEKYCSKKCEMEANGNNMATHVPANQNSNSGGLISSFFSPSQQVDNTQEDKIEAKIESIAAIQFGADHHDISNVLNQLVTIASGKPSTEVKKAIYEKMEYGILKLRQIGAATEADFFEKKRVTIKPKWWDSF